MRSRTGWCAVALVLAACSNAPTASPAAGGVSASAGSPNDPRGPAGTGDTSGGAPTVSGGSLGVDAGGMLTTAGTGAIGGTDADSGGDTGGSAAGNATGAAGTASSSAGCPGLFCENFESGKIDPAIWDTQTYAGQTVVVQSTTVAHGKYAVQFHAKPSTTSYDFIITKNAPTALKQHFFGRAYFYITPKPPELHTEFMFAGSPGFPTYNYIELSNKVTDWQGTFVHLIVPAGGVKSATGTQEIARYGGPIPLVKWACLEWEFNDVPDQETVWVDGVQGVSFPDITLNGTSSGLVGGFADFGFGFYAWHPASYAFDLYYDDIVLDTKRIGCL